MHGLLDTYSSVVVAATRYGAATNTPGAAPDYSLDEVSRRRKPPRIMGGFVPAGPVRFVGDPMPSAFWDATAREVRHSAARPKAATPRDLRAQLRVREERLSSGDHKVDIAEVRLIRKVLASVDDGHEAAVVSAWRRQLASRRRVGEWAISDTEGVGWVLSPALFAAFDRLQRFIQGGGLTDRQPGQPEGSSAESAAAVRACSFCHSPWPPGGAYCYGCGRDRGGRKASPTMRRRWWWQT